MSGGGRGRGGSEGKVPKGRGKRTQGSSAHINKLQPSAEEHERRKLRPGSHDAQWTWKLSVADEAELHPPARSLAWSQRMANVQTKIAGSPRRRAADGGTPFESFWHSDALDPGHTLRDERIKLY